MGGSLPFSPGDRGGAQSQQDRLSVLLACGPQTLPLSGSPTRGSPNLCKPAAGGQSGPETVRHWIWTRPWQDPESLYLNSRVGPVLSERGGGWQPVGEGRLAYPGAPSSVLRGACSLSFRAGRTGFVWTTLPEPSCRPVSTLIHPSLGFTKLGMPGYALAFSLYLSPSRHHILLFLLLKCPPSSVLIQTS